MVSATEAETVDRPATGPEIVALNASVVAKMRARAFGASVPIPSEAKAPRNGKRRPLGLAPIDGDDDKAAAAPAFVAGLPSAAASFTAETLARGAVMADVAESLDCATAIALDLAGALKAQIAELHGENARLTTELARLRAQFAEAKAEFGEAKHILERLQITREGKRGERGPCGADGAPGPRGEKGERGERGAPALTVIEWRPDSAAFTVQAVMSDGSTGPMIALRSLFESYHAATSWVEDADLVEAARASRAQADAEAEAARWTR